MGILKIEIRVKEIERLVTEEIGDNCHSRVIQYEELDTTYSYQMRELGENYERFEKNINSIHGIALEEELIYWKITEIFQKDPSEVTEEEYEYLMKQFEKLLELDLSSSENPKELKNVKKFFENLLLEKNEKTEYAINRSKMVETGKYYFNSIYMDLVKKYWEKIFKTENEQERIKLINQVTLLEQIMKSHNGMGHLSKITIESIDDVKKTDTIELGYKVVVYLNEMPYREFLYFQYTNNGENILDKVLKDDLKDGKKKITVELTKHLFNKLIGEAISKGQISVKVIAEVLELLGIFVDVNNTNQKIDNQILLIDAGNIIDVFCISASIVIEDNNKLVINSIDVDYKKLATKIYVYVKKHGNFSSMEEFYNQYKGDKTNLNGEAEKLEGFIEKYQQDYLQEKEQIEKIESWLKGE